MARGVRAALNGDIGVAVTGIAGPGVVARQTRLEVLASGALPVAAFDCPAEASVPRGNALGDGPGVHVGPHGEVVAKSFCHRGDQCFELFAEHGVIVVSPGVTRNPAARLVASSPDLRDYGLIREGLSCVVVERADNDTPGLGEHASGIGALRIVQIAHLARVAARQPLVAMREFLPVLRRRHAAKIEAQRFGFGDNPVGVGLRSHDTIVLERHCTGKRHRFVSLHL